MIDAKFEAWANLQEFYGINADFPSEYLFYQKNTNNNVVFISEGMTNKFMKSTRKYKLNVVNLGVKMFSKNRDDKSNAQVNKLSSTHLFYSTVCSKKDSKSSFPTWTTPERSW